MKDNNQLKPIDEVNLQDMKKYPIWVFALGEENTEGIDETWQKPVTWTNNVTKDLVEAYILMRSEDYIHDVSACLDISSCTLQDVNYWDKEANNWITIEKLNYKKLRLIAVPKINGLDNVGFIFNGKKKAFEAENLERLKNLNIFSGLLKDIFENLS